MESTTHAVRPGDGKPVEKHFVRFLFPFALQSEPSYSSHEVFEATRERLIASSDWKLLKGGLRYILPHVEAFLFPDPNIASAHQYVAAFHLDKDECNRRFRQNTRYAFYTYADDGCLRYPFQIPNVQLFCFRSGVGVLILDCCLQEVEKLGDLRPALDAIGDVPAASVLPVNTDHLIHFCYHFRHLFFNQRKVGLCRYQRTQEEVEGGIDSVWTFDCLSVGEMLDELMEEAVGRENQNWIAFYERRLLGYGFASFAPHTFQGEASSRVYEQLARPLYWLRRFVSKKYEPALSDLRFEGNPEVLQTYENVYFGCSLEGGMTFALDTGIDFFSSKGGFQQRVHGNYFYLFLLALHQRLATILLARRLSNLAMLRQTQESYAVDVQQEAVRLREDIFDFKLRCWFADVSNMGTYTAVYRRWQQVLGVQPLLEEVKGEIEELEDYLRRARMDAERRREQQQQQLDRIAQARDRLRQKQNDSIATGLNLLTYVLLPLTIVSSVFGMNIAGYVDRGFPRQWLSFALIFVFVLFGILFYYTLRKRKKARHLEKELDERVHELLDSKIPGVEPGSAPLEYGPLVGVSKEKRKAP